jgi:ATP-dependent DNA ligase
LDGQISDDGKSSFGASSARRLSRRRVVCGSPGWHHFIFRTSGCNRPTPHNAPCVLAFDLLFLGGKNITGLPLLDRKERLQAFLKDAPRSIQYSDHQVGDGQRFWEAACGAKAEGIISKRIDARYAPGNRGIWCKSKCYGREEFIIIGYTEPEGSRPHLGALLLAYYDDASQLLYAGRAGTGMSAAELGRVHDRLQPLRISKMPANAPPPRTTRFGSPLVLSRVHWVRPELVSEVRFLAWTADRLLRQVVYEGLREDKPAKDERRTRPA